MSDRALLVGINHHPDPAVPALRGCLADVADVHRLLTETAGFDPAGIQTLEDGDASRANVLEGLKWLTADARPGDRRTFHFSGHGSYTVDTDGDEADRLDEILITADRIDWADSRTFLVDDELARWLTTVPAGVAVMVLLDCCHSGTGTRELRPPPLPPGASRRHRPPRYDEASTKARIQGRKAGARNIAPSIPPERLPFASPELVVARFAPPPEAIGLRAQALPAGKRRKPAGRPSAPPVPLASVTTYAACRADQTAADAYMGDGFRGAFTWAFCRSVRELGIGVGRSTLAGRLDELMRAHRLTQQPQIEESGPKAK